MRKWKKTSNKSCRKKSAEKPTKDLSFDFFTRYIKFIDYKTLTYRPKAQNYTSMWVIKYNNLSTINYLFLMFSIFSLPFASAKVHCHTFYDTIHSHSGCFMGGGVRNSIFIFTSQNTMNGKCGGGCGKFKRKWVEFKASHMFFENFSRCAYNVIVNRYLSFCVSQQACQRGNPEKCIANLTLINHFQFHPNSCINSKEISIFSPFSARFSQLNPIIILFRVLQFSLRYHIMHVVINIATKWDLDELVFSKSLISHRQHATSTSCFHFLPFYCTHILLVSNIRNSWIFSFSFIKNPTPRTFPAFSPSCIFPVWPK